MTLLTQPKQLIFLFVFYSWSLFWGLTGDLGLCWVELKFITVHVFHRLWRSQVNMVSIRNSTTSAPRLKKKSLKSRHTKCRKKEYCLDERLIFLHGLICSLLDYLYHEILYSTFSSSLYNRRAVFVIPIFQTPHRRILPSTPFIWKKYSEE